ncbi:hypothetical protein OL229_21595 [Neisseriaceae bacterium JH1-16]|nr:hypothetical protein [Neisseriaceae bacterium JH1-16]
MQTINTQDRWFHDGNPATGELGTIVPANWLNSIQAELLSVLAAGNLTADPTNNSQLLNAIKQLAWNSTSTRPSTLAGYGITDGLTGSDIVLPLSALPNPTITSSDNRLTILGAIAMGQGGTVSIPAGVAINLGQEASSGQARSRSFVTTAWVSPVLSTSSEYYLRAQVASGGELTFYVQRGNLLDLPPASQKGTVNGTSGGGFLSTPLDMCIARIITGAAGSLPTVQRTLNRATFAWTVTLNGTGTLYLPFDPHTRTARLTAANPTPHPTLLSNIFHGSAGWQGSNYAYIAPNSTPYISPSIAWGGGAIIIHSNNVIGDMTISTSSAQFDHINAKSLWQLFQTEHQQGDMSTTATSDELLLAMGIKTIQQIDYDSGLAINYQNCVNAQFSWEIVR